MYTVLPDFSAIKIRGALLDLYLALRWVLIPVCWPTDVGTCGCGWNHKAKEVGKAPLVPLHAAESGVLTPAYLLNRLTMRSRHNVGVLLGPSDLFVVDADSEAAVREVEARGVPAGPVAARAERRHFIFSRPPGISGRVIRAGDSRDIDVLASGLVVVPPSRHRAGQPYSWLVPPTDNLPPAPQWAVDLLRRGSASPCLVSLPPDIQPRDINTVNVSARIRQLVAQGPDAEPGRYVSRSEALFACVLALVNSGCSDGEIAAVVMNPVHAISEKPRERGLPWLAGELQRARAMATVSPAGSHNRGPRRTVRVEVA